MNTLKAQEPTHALKVLLAMRNPQERPVNPAYLAVHHSAVLFRLTLLPPPLLLCRLLPRYPPRLAMPALRLPRSPRAHLQAWVAAAVGAAGPAARAAAPCAAVGFQVLQRQRHRQAKGLVVARRLEQCQTAGLRRRVK